MHIFYKDKIFNYNNTGLNIFHLTFPFDDVRYSSSISGAENKCRASSIVWTASCEMSRWRRKNGSTVAEGLFPDSNERSKMKRLD